MGHRPEQLVADGVAKGVVHLLEVVEVEAEHGEAGLAPGLGDRPLDPLAQQHAIGQVGHGVVPGHVGDAGLGIPAFGRLLVDRHEAAAVDRLDLDGDDAAVGEMLDLGRRGAGSHQRADRSGGRR